jgi:hypothetical protein
MRRPKQSLKLSLILKMQGFNHVTVLAPAVSLISSDIRKLWKKHTAK